MKSTDPLKGSFDNTEAHRVLHITEAWGGGVVTSARSMADASKDVSHYFFVRDRSDVQIETDLNVYFQNGNILVFFWRAISYARRVKPHFIFLHSSFAGLLRFVWPIRSNVIFVPHCFAVERADLNPFTKSFIRFVESRLARTRTSILAMSEREVQIASSLGSKRILRYCNYAPIASKKFTEFGQVKRIGIVGRISVQKNPLLFSSVVEELSDLNLDWVWIGDGDTEIKKQLENNQVRVTGWLNTEDTMIELEHVDLILHTASWEGSPVSTLESLSRGKPVISSAIPSMESLGYFIAGSDSREIATTIRAALQDRESWDEVLRKSKSVLSSNNAVLAEQYMSEILNG
jgi:glycosyltransferase involved in cell wall biosynthesis